MTQLETRLSGRGLLESPRWHEGALWFADWTAGEILRIARDGSLEVKARAAAPPLSFDFASDGRMLIVASGERHLLRRESDGSLAPVAELGPEGGYNEIVVDGRGNAYVNGPRLVLITADGRASAQAEGFAFPNGMAVTPDNTTLIVAESWAEQLTGFDIAADGQLSGRRIWAPTPGDHPDGVCIDAEGAVWYADVGARHCRRVAAGGEVLDEIALDRAGFACVLGGATRQTLYITAATWFGMDRMSEMGGSGCVYSAPVAVAGAGWP